MNETERRRHLRVALNCPGTVQFGRGPEISIELIDISEGGVRFLLPQVVALGAGAELRFTLPRPTAKECLVFGRVQHYHRVGESYVLGVEFARVTAEVTEAIRAFVKMRESSK